MTLTVTAFVAAVCALLLLVTAIDTVRQRLRVQAAWTLWMLATVNL